ncbi:MAG TPA: DUF5676 family membrane protein [Candidatus Udaeobacter sp.]|nr:DUF5676 family membrane protein [Candidatus Udaeobacter sp.]
MNNTARTLSPRHLGFAFGATGVLFYLGCVLTMSTVPRETAIIFFNSLLHGIDVAPILREHVSPGEVCLGILGTFVLGWFAGALVALFYNLGLILSKKE